MLLANGTTQVRFRRHERRYGLDYFEPERLFVTNLCEALIALSVRCIQPTQQQGRRFPSVSCETVRLT